MGLIEDLVSKSTLSVPEGLHNEDEATPQQLRTLTKNVKNASENLGLVEGKLLKEIRDKEHWRLYGYPSFGDYIETELEHKQRKGQYLVQLYEKLVVECGVGEDEIQKYSVSKLKLVLPVVSPSNIEDWLERCGSLTVAELEAEIKNAKTEPPQEESSQEEEEQPPADPADPAKEEDIVKKTFPLYSPQLENVQSALALAEKMTGSDKRGHLLDVICSEFLTASLEREGFEGFAHTIDRYKDILECTFGVEIEIKAVNNTNPIVKEAKEE